MIRAPYLPLSCVLLCVFACVSAGCSELGPDPQAAVMDLREQICNEAAGLGAYGQDVVDACSLSESVESLALKLADARREFEAAKAAAERLSD
jgi:hypothetical protein